MVARIVEAGAWLIGPGIAAGMTWVAVEGSLATARGGAAEARTPEEVRATAATAIGLYLVGVLMLAAARLWSLRRGRHSVEVPLLLPALASLVGLGLAVQMGYGDPAHYAGFPGRDAGRGALIALLVAAGVVAQPVDPGRLLARVRPALLPSVLGVFLLLLLFGSAPGGSDQRIQLWGWQPLEGVKLLFVAGLAAELGARAPKLRWQRQGSAWLRMPRWQVLVPSVAVVGVVLLGLLVVRDLGPVVVLGALYLAMFYAVTRSFGWAALVSAIGGGAAALVLAWPEAVSSTLAVRAAMWRDPWTNGLPVKQEVGEALWSLGSGGLAGQGPGRSMALLRFGHNDLVLAQLGEDLGLLGLCFWLGGIGIVVASACFVAAQGRSAERQLLALGLGGLFAAQAGVIFLGVTGMAPLTGIVAPLLAKGTSALVAFSLAAAVVARLAEDGARRADEDVLREIGRSAVELGALAAAALLFAVGVAAHRTVIAGAEHSGRGIVVTLGDGSVKKLQNPRLVDLARRLRRGSLRSVDGEDLAVTGEDGARRWPLGDDLGTLLGPVNEAGVQRGSWMLEERLEQRLRGWPDREPGEVAWVWPDGALAAVLPADVDPTAHLLAGAAERGIDPPAPGSETTWRKEVAGLRRVVLDDPDLSAFVPLLSLSPEAREARIVAWADDVASRSVTLTLHAGLQRRAAAVVQEAAKGGEAAAAVLIDVDTGEVLARAQWPDFDPAGAPWTAWGDATVHRRDTGPYGAWSDKTGLRGVLQSGSVFKVYTALAAARAGQVRGQGCSLTSGPTFSCVQRDGDGPAFTRAGWRRPIHDYRSDPNHGEVALIEGLAESCNVYFGQLGLALGAEKLSALAELGVEVAWGGPLRPGKDGSRELASTAFGQGRAALHPLAAARLVAAAGAGGVYRVCPPTMEDGQPCAEVALLDDPSATGPILRGMQAVMTEGTGARLAVPPGLRVYGKTGTADAEVLKEEAPYGVRQATPHSWFVAIGEAEQGSACETTRQGRVAVAVVVPRGGSGARSAGPAAMKLLAAAQAEGFLGGAGR